MKARFRGSARKRRRNRTRKGIDPRWRILGIAMLSSFNVNHRNTVMVKDLYGVYVCVCTGFGSHTVATWRQLAPLTLVQLLQALTEKVERHPDINPLVIHCTSCRSAGCRPSFPLPFLQALPRFFFSPIYPQDHKAWLIFCLLYRDTAWPNMRMDSLLRLLIHIRYV